MNFTEKLKIFFSGKHAFNSPLLIIKKDTDAIGIEYKSIEDAIADLENDPNVPSDKIEKLKSSLRNLKNKTSIRIRNGEII
jgi:hypothetical protein